MKKFLKKLQDKWLFVTVGLGVIIIPSGILYYGFFVSPKAEVKSFISGVEAPFKQGKEDTTKLENFILNWEDVSKGDLDKKKEEIKKIRENFDNLLKNLGKTDPKDEIEETHKILKQFAEKGISTAENLETIASYFQKVEESVKAFNKLNTDSKTLEEINSLVLNFKSISEESLKELEKIEAPKPLINLDKDYKDLLRQYIKSANDLLDAVSKKDTKRIESIGKESDEAVVLITKQLEEDMRIFKETSDLLQELLKMKQFEKSIDENIGSLKAKYGL